MMFDDIIDSIKSGRNAYEESRGIKTESVGCLFKHDGIAFFLAHKSDNTNTLFIAFMTNKNNVGSWFWWCPSEPQSEGLINVFPNLYRRVDLENKESKTKEEKP